MRHPLLRIIIVAVLICGASFAFAKMAGAPKGRTGAPAVGSRPAEPNCQNCHDGALGLNNANGLLEILDLPEQFDLDTDYPIRVRLSQAWDPVPALKWGFELTAVRADSGTGYGAFTPGTGTEIATQTIPGTDPTRTYITHSTSGLHAGESGPVEWSFTWRSPGYVAGKVLFFAAGNAANGDELSSGDYIHTTSDSMSFVALGVGEFAHGGTQLAPPTPNPVRDRGTLYYTIARAGVVDLAIFDVSGRRLRTLTHGDRTAGRGSVTWDGRDAAGRRLSDGIYFAKLLAPGVATPRVQKITLSR